MMFAPSFNQKAATYQASADVQADSASWLAEMLPAKVENGLELGAGTGLFTGKMKGGCRQLTATDLAPKMVEAGRALHPTVDWRVLDAWVPPDGGVQYDLVGSSSLLQWASDPVGVLGCWRERIRPGGQLLVGLYVEPSLKELKALQPTGSAFAWRSAAEWRSAVQKTGLVIEQWEERSACYIYPSSLVLLRKLHATGVVMKRNVLAYQGTRLLLANYTRQFAGGGGVYATWSTLLIRARRVG